MDKIRFIMYLDERALTQNKKGGDVMSTKKSLLYALGVTIVSCVLLTVTRGIPTVLQLTERGAPMFVLAFVALKFFSGESNHTSGKKDT